MFREDRMGSIVMASPEGLDGTMKSKSKKMLITVPGRTNNQGGEDPAVNFRVNVEERNDGTKRITSATAWVDHRDDEYSLVLTWDHPKHHRVAQAEVYAVCAYLELASDHPDRKWVIEPGRISNLGAGKTAAVIHVEPFRGDAKELAAIRDMLNSIVNMRGAK